MPEPIPATLTSLVVPVDGLVPYPSNPRKGNLQQIVDSLERHGQYRPIVVRAKTFEVLAGNHTLAAAKALGWHEIAATFVDVTDDEAARIVLVDNRTNDLGRYDDELLANVLANLPDLDGTGYDADDLDLLLALREPHYGGDLREVLDAADESVWPWVRAQLDPGTYETWQALPGDDDTAKLRALLAAKAVSAVAVNMLVSFAFFADQNLAAYRAAMPCGRLMVDSGAFTASSTGKPVVLAAYAEFLERWRGAIDHAVTLDVIGDPTATRRNTKWLHDRGHRVLPVFTRGDRLAEFDAMVRDSRYVCVGGGVGMPSRVVVPRLAGLQHRAEELGGGIHALGLGNMPGLRRVRPYSADNSRISSAFVYGGLCYYDGRDVRSVAHGSLTARHLLHFKDAGLAPDVLGIMRSGRLPGQATRSRLMRGMVLAGAAADEDAAQWGVPGIGLGDTGGSHLYMAITGDELATATASVDRLLHDPSWTPPPLWARYAAAHERQCRKLRVVPAVTA